VWAICNNQYVGGSPPAPREPEAFGMHPINARPPIPGLQLGVQHRTAKRCRQASAKVLEPGLLLLPLHLSFEDDASGLDRGPHILRLAFCTVPAWKIRYCQPSRHSLVDPHHSRPCVLSLVIANVQGDSMVHRAILHMLATRGPWARSISKKRPRPSGQPWALAAELDPTGPLQAELATRLVPGLLDGILRLGEAMVTKPPYPPVESWKRRLSLVEAEAESSKRAEECGCPISPQWQERWNTFVRKMQPADELWYWEYFPQPMTGGAGYCIVRDGSSIAWIATMRS
jgi:hypothetical protein